MKYLHFKIPIYDWDVHYVEVEKNKDSYKVEDVFDKLGFFDKDIDKVLKNIKDRMTNTGMLYTCNNISSSVILIYTSSNKKERMSSILHEKRHLEDRIIERMGLEGKESAAYLAGYIGKKLIPIL